MKEDKSKPSVQYTDRQRIFLELQKAIQEKQKKDWAARMSHASYRH